MEFAQTYGMKYLETSAKTAFNVNETFVTMTKDIIALNSEKDKAIKKGIYSNFKITIFICQMKSLADSSLKIKTNFKIFRRKGKNIFLLLTVY